MSDGLPWVGAEGEGEAVGPALVLGELVDGAAAALVGAEGWLLDARGSAGTAGIRTSSSYADPVHRGREQARRSAGERRQSPPTSPTGRHPTHRNG